MQRVVRRLSYANVVATLALFVALGGSSYAAVKLGRNAVKSRNIAPNAITGAKVKNHSLTAADLATSVLKTGATGATGAKGDTGAAGPAGAKGDPGATAVKYFATVYDDGSLRRGTPGTTVEKLGGASPYYVVHFPGSVGACSPVVSSGNTTSNGILIANGYARTAAETGAPGDSNTVEVGFYRLASATASGPVYVPNAAGFNLIVAC